MHASFGDFKFAPGDRVIRMSGRNADMEPGDKGTVVDSDYRYVTIAEYRGLFRHEIERFKLVKTVYCLTRKIL